MKKPFLLLIIFMITIACTSLVEAAAATTLNLSVTGAVEGDSVTVSGSADPETWIAVKVTDESNNIVFFDEVRADLNGVYNCTFVVPAGSGGTLTATAGYGSNVASASLTVNATQVAGIVSTAPVSLAEDAANDGSLASGTVVITIANGTIAEDITKGDVTAANLPAGLDYTVTRTDAVHLTIDITGNAGNHDSAHDVSNLTFTIAQAKVAGAEGDLTTANISIDFSDPAAPVTYNVTYDANNGTGNAPAPTNKIAGETFTAADNTFTPPSGKKFKKWYTNPIGTGGTGYVEGAAVTMPAVNLILYAIWEDEIPGMKKSYLEVMTLSGGTVRLNGDAAPISSVFGLQQEMGTPIRLEAMADAGYTFAYWINIKNSTVISTNPVYEVIMGAGINVMAVFTKVPTAEDTHFAVTFKDKSGRILQSTSVAKNGTVTPPNPPNLIGYNFSRWSHSLNNVTSGMMITALYVRADETYNVTVENGALSTDGNEGNFKYDMPVTVVAGMAPTGKKFSHWEQDGIKVSTKSTFAFFAPMRDTILTAVFVDNEAVIENEPFITLSSDVKVNTQERSIMFTALKDVPADCTLVECGVLLLKAEGPLGGALTVDTAGVILGKMLDQSSDQFYIIKSNVETGDTWYGRAYLIYKDGNNNSVIVYSDYTANKTMEGE